MAATHLVRFQLRCWMFIVWTKTVMFFVYDGIKKFLEHLDDSDWT